MRVFILNLRDLSPQMAARMTEALPQKRRETVLRCHKDPVRLAKAAGYHLVRYAAAQLGVSLPFTDFEAEEHGKPYFPHYPLHFNLSHAAGFVAVAVSKTHPVGIDIEEIRPLREGFGARWFSAAEQALLAHAKEKDAACIRLWTAKEAAAKMTGCGLAYNLSAIDTASTASTILECSGTRLALSVAPAKEMPALTVLSSISLLQ